MGLQCGDEIRAAGLQWLLLNLLKSGSKVGGEQLCCLFWLMSLLLFEGEVEFVMRVVSSEW